MIYDYPKALNPILQGDIFYPLPFHIIESLDKLNIISGEDFDSISWDDVNPEDITVAALPIKPVWGIVASQNCDTSRIPYITFFLIDTLQDISRLTLPDEKKTKNWVSLITQKSRLNANWFYLPKDDKIGFDKRMAVNFEEAFLIDREFLQRKKEKYRKGRLNEIAYQHYREKVSQYYRRYPYDEWYPLNKIEFDYYQKSYKNKGIQIDSFKWQDD